LVVPRTAVVSAFVRRDFRITRSYRVAFLLDLVYGPLELAVYFFISRAFGDLSTSDLQGAPSYFAYAAVGVVLGAVVSASTSNIGYTLREEQLTGTFEALAAQPIKAAELCAGLLSFPLVYAFVRATAYLAIAAYWMELDVSETDWLGLALVLVSSAGALAGLGVVAGAVVLVFKRGQLIVGTLIFAMTFVSGAVFPIEVLPAPLEVVARFSPIRFALDGARAALFSGEGWGNDVLALLIWGVVLLPLSLWLFSSALGYARRAGSLAQY
jgi:ABC-2 type transport system permease protein